MSATATLVFVNVSVFCPANEKCVGRSDAAVEGLKEFESFFWRTPHVDCEDRVMAIIQMPESFEVGILIQHQVQRVDDCKINAVPSFSVVDGILQVQDVIL